MPIGAAIPNRAVVAPWAPRAILLEWVAAAMLVVPLVAGSWPRRITVFALPLVAVGAVVLLPRRTARSLVIPLPVAAFAGWAIASYAWSADRLASRQRLADLVAAIAVGWIVGSYVGLERLRHVVTLVGQVVIVATLAAVAVAPGWSTRPPVDDLTAIGWHGVLGHKNGLGLLIAIALVPMWMERREHPPTWRLWVLAGAVVLVGARSSTAQASLAAAISFGILVLALRREDRLVSRLGLVAATIAAVATTVLLVLENLPLVSELLGRDATLTGRTKIWSVAWSAAWDRPLTGWGFGGVWTDPVPPTDAMWYELNFRAFHAHNGLLDVFLQLGVVGVAAILAVVVTTVRGNAADWHGAGSLWGAVVVVQLAVASMAESSPLIGYGVFLIVAAATAAASRRRHPLPVPARPDGERLEAVRV